MSATQPSLIASLRGHLAFRVATAYAIGGWLLIQLADISLEAFGAPEWIMRWFLLLVLGGFPIAIIVAWSLARSQSRGNTVVAGLSIFFAVVVSVMIYGFTGVTNSEGAGEEQIKTAQNDVRSSNPVVAVLPFTNMSSDAENEFVADGMTEDIITLLAQSPGLEVIARNSTFKFKNTSPDVRAVGRDLGAEYIVEGSIRPLGDRIRVTVQVIEAATGAHTWADQFDRPLDQFFSVQDDISLGVAAAVGDAVFREEYDRLKQSRTADLTAWARTHQAEQAFNLTQGPEPIEWAREAIALDPTYALAHAVLGRALSSYIVFGAGIDGNAALLLEAEQAARKAHSLAPNDAKVLAYLAMTLLWTGQPKEGLPFAAKSVELSPGYAEGLSYYGDLLIHNGKSEKAIPYLEKAIQLTPNAVQTGVYYGILGEAFIHHGNFNAAEQALVSANHFLDGTNQLFLRYQAGCEFRLGKVEQARATLAEAQALNPDRTLATEAKAMTFYSTDRGGDNFLTLWRDLEALPVTPTNSL